MSWESWAFIGVVITIFIIIGAINYFLKLEFLRMVWERRFGIKIKKIEEEKREELKKQLYEPIPNLRGLEKLEECDIIWQYKKRQLRRGK